ncbi:MAG: hypothetical protein ACP5QK_03930 [Myxococcota bacterium]
MRYRIYLLIFILLNLAFLVEAEAGFRLTSSTGFSFKNDLSKETAEIFGMGLHILYPVSKGDEVINTEIGAATWFNYYTLGTAEMQTLRFGLAIRVYFNLFEEIVPFFTHDILSQITYLSDRKKSAQASTIILGLGAKTNIDNSIFSALFTEFTYARSGSRIF